MKSKIFYSKRYKEIERDVLNLINSAPDFLSNATAGSPRAAGDAIESIISESFKDILGDLCAEYSSAFARRAMADLAFKDTADNYYIVDVKTHRTDTKFNMPNLTSVERLARFYEDDNNYFTIMMVSYEVNHNVAIAKNVHFIPIEFLDWDCLTIGALGWGQIQIANSNKIKINPEYSRKKWMLEFCEAMLSFYPKEVAKIAERLDRFNEVKSYWLAKAE